MLTHYTYWDCNWNNTFLNQDQDNFPAFFLKKIMILYVIMIILNIDHNTKFNGMKANYKLPDLWKHNKC